MYYTIHVNVNKRAENLRVLYFIHSCFFRYFCVCLFFIINHFLGRIVVRLIVHVTDCLADETNNKVHNVRNRVQNRLVTQHSA